MTTARQCRLDRAWLLTALCALGCGIAERTVEERDEGAGSAGESIESIGGTHSAGTGKGGSATGGHAGKSSMSLGGTSTGSAAGPSNAAGQPNDELGLELDPVPVGNPPLPPCSCGEGCAQTLCSVQTVGTAAGFLMNVFVRDSQAYWMGRERLERTALDDAADPFAGKPRTVVTQLQFPSRVVVDGTSAYFTSYAGLWKVPRSAQTLNLSGAGEAQLLCTFQPWKRRVTEIALDSRHVYWTLPNTELLARLVRTSIYDGKSTELARLEDEDDGPLGIAVDDTDVYFTSNARLLRVAKAGGDLEELQRIDASVSYDQIHPTLSVALDERWVYYDAGNELRRLSKADGTSVTLFVVPSGDALRGIVVDEYYVYFGTRSGSIYRSDKVEGPPRVMVAGELNPLVSAVSKDALYWIEQDAGRVRSAMK
jgi:hypothetical protein